jgi:hypothetical protein
MDEGLILLIVIVGWFVVNRYVLPKMGIGT